MIAFNERYDKDTFLAFLRDFLPEDYSENERDIRHINSCQIIKSARELGFCESLDVTVLEMSHSKNTDPRVTVATDAFKILKTYDIQKALVIFKNDESENYRFSYLTITLDIDEKSNMKKSHSNARRYSFYLGKGAKVRTPEQQLVKKGRVQSIDDLFNRFSVEVVNKQFYLEIAKYFDELVAEDTSHLVLPFQMDINVRKSFAVRLIGRLMFCWFLKQKKSANGQLVPDEILSSHAVKNNYYHETLERLFFEVLNTNIEERDIRNDLFDKVPYLNGGLFNPQSNDYYELDREIFVSKYINTLKIDDSWFKRFFELLETYNFTIDENTVFDQELSVDPEMLGRIFENLLAEINPETGTSERKRTGSFYTPRQIVEYMVDHSLIEYLRNKTGIDEKKLLTLVSYDLNDDLEFPLSDKEKSLVVDAIDTLKVLDPACGSGAFPIGALQKIVFILQAVDQTGLLWRNKKLENVPELYRTKIENELSSQTLNYIRKLEVIKNSIFGVDIQPIAVEVSRLRCFLTLVVESEIDETKKNRGIQALPNLDFKFVCANTLLPAPEKSSGEADKLFGDDFQERLTIAVDKYFSSSGENKRSANNEIHKLIDAKVDEKLSHLQSLVSYNGDKKIEAILAKTKKNDIEEHSRILILWSSYKNIFENKPVGFFDPKYFFPSIKNGFDIVIGNPPYGAELDEMSRKIIKNTYNFKTQETAILFMEKGQSLLKQIGVLSYIIPKAFTFSSNYKNIRNHIRDSLLEIIDCGKAFENVKLEAIMFILSNSSSNPDYISSFFDGRTIEKKSIIDKTLLEVFGLFPNALKKTELEIGLKIKNSTIQFGAISSNQRGELIQKHLSDSGEIAVIGGKEIDKYGIRGIKGYTGSQHVSEKAEIKINSILVQNIIAHIQNPTDHIKIIACIPSTPDYLIVDTINQIEITKKEYSKEYIWALLNSNLMNWYAYNFILGKAIRTMHFDNSVSSRLPIFEVNLENKVIVEKIENGVKEIHKIKATDRELNTSNQESQINELIMDLYELDDAEKEIIRNS